MVYIPADILPYLPPVVVAIDPGGEPLPPAGLTAGKRTIHNNEAHTEEHQPARCHYTLHTALVAHVVEHLIH